MPTSLDFICGRIIMVKIMIIGHFSSYNAGDAGILTGMLLNMTLLDSCRLGSIIASFVVETNGAQTQIYQIKDIRTRFLKTYEYIPQELEGL